MYIQIRDVSTLDSKTTHVAIMPLNFPLNPIYHLLALLGAHHIFHVSRIRVNTTNVRPAHRPASSHRVFYSADGDFGVAETLDILQNMKQLSTENRKLQVRESL